MNRITFDATDWWNWQRQLPRLVLLACVAALLTAYIAEYVFGYRPCKLCLWQRVPYFAAAALALVSLAASGEQTRRLALGACAVAFIVGGSIALHHVGVERHWWGNVTSCGGELPISMSTSDFLAALSAPPDPACDAPIWIIFGFSAAIWNTLLNVVLAALTIFGLSRIMFGTKGAAA